MEVGVRIIGVVLRILNLLLAPFFWLASLGKNGSVPRDDNPVLMYSVVELAQKIKSGELTSEHVVSTYIDRIKFVNPYLNAVVDERYRDALEDARAVDRLLAEARSSGDWKQVEGKPLLGVPFTVKESCLLKGLSNSVGCLEFAGRRATSDGAAVAMVRAAGAIPLLVSSTPEFCLGWETTNPLHGTTNNPYCLSRTPGGSSGGEAALLASGASPFGVVSDIAGSIRVPAAFCGLFGHKPSPGIISIAGHIPYLNDPQYPRFLAIGPMVRRAGDLAPLIKVMAGDAADILRLDDPVDMRTVRVHYMTEAGKSVALIDTDRCIKERIVAAVRYLEKECGAQICEKKFVKFEDSVEISIGCFFAMKDIPKMLQDPADPKKEKSLIVELARWALGGGSRSLQSLGFALIERTKLFMGPETRERYQREAVALNDQIQEALGSTGVLVYPAFPGAAHPRGGVIPRASGVAYTMLFNILGLPATTVPLGLHKGLPLALQVIAAPNQDRLCIAVAQKLEEAFGGWRPPP